ncbi:hypothetical protein ACHWQZ_G011445 [Mnemiopsis leidyi]
MSLQRIIRPNISVRVVFALIVFLSVCSGKNTEVANSINSFGLKLLRHCPSGENVMISPFSISTAMAMLNTGAGGETKTQIDRAFGWTGVKDVLGKFRTLQTSVSSGSGTMFNMTSNNRMYVDNRFQPLESYTRDLSENFQADVEKVNFGSGDNSETVEEINSWVEEKTNGKIRRMFDQINSNTAAILINTIYFNAQWKNPFTKTVKRQFYLDGENHVMTDMMTVTASFKYYKTDEAEVVAIPYQSGVSDISMIVINPTTRGGLMALEKRVIRKRFSVIKKWINQSYRLSVQLSLPKFEFGSKLSNLKEILQAWFGVENVFDMEKADLSGISGERDLFVSKVIHQSFISVDEKRTEAAAAAAVQIMYRRGPKVVSIDHPFMFIIYDNKNKVILFMGRVLNPTVGN